MWNVPCGRCDLRRRDRGGGAVVGIGQLRSRRVWISHRTGQIFIQAAAP